MNADLVLVNSKNIQFTMKLRRIYTLCYTLTSNFTKMLYPQLVIIRGLNKIILHDNPDKAFINFHLHTLETFNL